MADENAWIGLVEETREALAHLRADELEALAVRAQQALDAGAPQVRAATGLHDLAARHKLLGEVLEATERNIAVLRRLRGREYGRADRGTPWVL